MAPDEDQSVPEHVPEVAPVEEPARPVVEESALAAEPASEPESAPAPELDLSPTAVPPDSISPTKAAAGAGAAVDPAAADYGAQHTDVFQECAVPDCKERDDRRVIVGALHLVLCELHRAEDGVREALGL